MTNFHTHCNFCDGFGEAEEYVLMALEKGFTSLGFSSHAPLGFDNEWTMRDDDLPVYLKHIEELKEKYRDRIKIYRGLEIDYFPHINRFELFSSRNLDFSLGAVHVIKEGEEYFSVDGSTEELDKLYEQHYDSDGDRLAAGYYSRMRDMILQGGFDIIAHLDLLKKLNKNNRYFDESSLLYRKEVCDTLDCIDIKSQLLEVNTGAMSRGYTDTPYPSPWILNECKKRDIRIILNSDCHNPKWLDFYFPESLAMIKRAGYSEVYTPFERIKLDD